MSVTPRQKVLLGVLGFLLLFALWQAFGGSDDGGGTAPPPAAVDEEGDAPVRRQLPGARRGGARREVVEEVTALRLADLDIQPRDYAPGRDPWRYYEPPPSGPSPEELARRAAEAERQRLLLEEQRRQAELRALEEQRRQAELNPPPPPVPQPPPFPYTYLGNIGPPGKQIAVFSDGKGVIINRRQGGVIDGKFVVAQIGYESVDIQFVGFPNTPAERRAIGR